MTTQQTDPVQDNSATTQEVVKEPVTSPVASTDNDETPEKKEELSRKLHSSKEEALRLKAENERLAQEKADLEAKLAQQSTSPEVPVTEQDVAYLKALGKKAGFAFQEDVQKPLQAIKQETFKERRDAEWIKFLESHPEYNKPGDPQSDKLFEAFQGELATYKEPSHSSEYKKLFEKAHKFVTLNEQELIQKGEALGQAKVNIANRLGGTSYGGTSAPKAQQPLSPERQAVSEGFAQAFPQYFKK